MEGVRGEDGLKGEWRAQTCDSSQGIHLGS